jgi:hypothetical protein
VTARLENPPPIWPAVRAAAGHLTHAGPEKAAEQVWQG